MSDIMIFKRYEKKYLLTKDELENFMSKIRQYIIPDKHGLSTVCSLYLDTPDYLLIRNSIDAKAYKEKLRIRSYGVPDDDTKVFFEIKKKYRDIVYKRRVSMKKRTAFEYIKSGVPPMDTQIMREIDYLMKFYRQPKPGVCILCQREAYFASDDPDVRLTFDHDLRYRFGFPNKENITDGVPIVADGECVMEIKTAGAMPLWLARALSECKIYPKSFSKYANAYFDITRRNEK